MWSDPVIIIFLLVVNLAAVAMAFIAWKRPAWGRLIFALNFLAASIFNLVFLMEDPSEYLYYAEFTMLESYRSFILGPFSNHLVGYLGFISVAQFFIGLALLRRGPLLRWAALAGIFFLVAIAPIGFAAFPATLILAVGMYFIYRRGNEQPLPLLRRRVA
jgi:hypothetical protein